MPRGCWRSASCYSLVCARGQHDCRPRITTAAPEVRNGDGPVACFGSQPPVLPERVLLLVRVEYPRVNQQRIFIRRLTIDRHSMLGLRGDTLNPRKPTTT